MVEILKPSLRAIKYSFLRAAAEYDALRPHWGSPREAISPPVFLIGCGRSGTTILGNLLSQHPDVCYLFEPYHLWAAVDPMTDVLNLFHRIDACLMMNGDRWTAAAQNRFNRLIISKQHCTKATILIEKTPHNALRIGYLNALAPSAKFIHLARNGAAVSASIARIAETSSYKIAGKTKLNQWWGANDYKWQALSREGPVAGYFAAEVPLLQGHLARAVYEWLVSLGEVDRWREKLHQRLYELTYEQLTADPAKTLSHLCEFLELRIDPNWLQQATSQLKANPFTSRIPLSLPREMCHSFNKYQQRLGVATLAVPQSSPSHSG